MVSFMRDQSLPATFRESAMSPKGIAIHPTQLACLTGLVWRALSYVFQRRFLPPRRRGEGEPQADKLREYPLRPFQRVRQGSSTAPGCTLGNTRVLLMRIILIGQILTRDEFQRCGNMLTFKA